MVRLILITLIVSFPIFSQDISASISGQVIDNTTALPLPRCNVIVTPGNRGTVTDSLGLFVLPLPYGSYHITFRYTGYEDAEWAVILLPDSPHQRRVIRMKSLIYAGEEVTVVGQVDEPAPDVQTIGRLDLRKIPNLYDDPLRSVKILPGVTSNNELSSNYNVRGGNYNENLIYLNGFEIYRPYLIRFGMEENQSLINPDMTESIHFYGGGFDARFGDRTSSVLEVEYGRKHSARLRGIARANLLNMGLSLGQKSGKIVWSLAGRYANPAYFLNRLLTSGNYQPRYSDLQLLMNYGWSANRQLEIFLLYADNQFNLTPQNWQGNFKMGLLDVRGIDLEYQGQQTYTYQTGLIGLTWRQNVSSATHFTVSAAGHLGREAETRNLSGEIYYIPDARYPDTDREYLKNRRELADNRLQLNGYELTGSFNREQGNHELQAGIGFKLSRLQNRVDESVTEQGEENLLEPDYRQYQSWDLDFNQLHLYVQDQYAIHPRIKLTGGIRYLYYDYTGEHLVSPRISLHFYPVPHHIFYLRWGYYYQPPFFYELRYRPVSSSPAVKSQQAVHYLAGWESRIKERLELQVEVFYKHLDHLIPFYMEDLKLIYYGENENSGYARGVDILIRGELIEGMNSWLGYGYLDTKEYYSLTGIHQNRLLDQRHTLRFFLQDKLPRFPNFQYHTRILWGSGYRFYPRKVIRDPETDQGYLQIDFSRQLTYPRYFRVDMGLSARFGLTSQRELVVMAEIMNVFNQYNVLGYSWYQVFQDSELAVAVPRVLSRRFVNIGLELSF